MQYKPLRLLVPLDGSWVAEQALVWAKTFAASTGSHVVLFRVELPLRASVFMAPVMGRPRAGDRPVSGTVLEYMDGVALQLREAGISIDVEIVHAVETEQVVMDARARIAERIGEAILARADEEDIDLVIVASHGITANYEVRWGSVCRSILAAARKPVLIVPAHPE